MLFNKKVIKDVKKKRTNEMRVVYKTLTKISGSEYLIAIISPGIVSHGNWFMFLIIMFAVKKAIAGINTINMQPIPRQAG